jgi:hypothetical protein
VLVRLAQLPEGGVIITYQHEFVSVCPNNGKSILYRLEILSSKMIPVEHIVTACALIKKGFHEDIAKELHERFGQRQTLRAHHHGVDIQTAVGEVEE